MSIINKYTFRDIRLYVYIGTVYSWKTARNQNAEQGHMEQRKSVTEMHLRQTRGLPLIPAFQLHGTRLSHFSVCCDDAAAKQILLCRNFRVHAPKSTETASSRDRNHVSGHQRPHVTHPITVVWPAPRGREQNSHATPHTSCETTRLHQSRSLRAYKASIARRQ